MSGVRLNISPLGTLLTEDDMTINTLMGHVYAIIEPKQNKLNVDQNLEKKIDRSTNPGTGPRTGIQATYRNQDNNRDHMQKLWKQT